MKTRIIFKGRKSDQSFELETDLSFQPADKTVMKFNFVDRVPEWVSADRWYVHSTEMYFTGDAVYPKELGATMVVNLKTTV